MTIERRHLAANEGGIEVRTNADGSKTAVGYASVFYVSGDPGTQYSLRNNLMERIMPGAFDDVINVDDVRGLFNHDSNHVLGRVGAGTVRLMSDDSGLRYEIDLPDTAAGRDLATLLERRDITGSSFGFTVATGGQSFHKEGEMSVRTISKIGRLYDVGPVTYPAYAGTSSAMRADDSAIDEELAALDAEIDAEARLQAGIRRAKKIRADMLKLGISRKDT